MWAIEDCRDLSHHLEQALIVAGERVVRVAPKLMGASRRGEREPGKSDQIDARAIARAVLREGIERCTGAGQADRFADPRAEALKRELRDLIHAHRPELLAEVGCGPLCAAILIGQTAGAERFKSDAHFARVAGVAPIPVSSDRHDRHRLDRGGNRQLNRALHIIAITRGQRDPATRVYLARKQAKARAASRR